MVTSPSTPRSLARKEAAIEEWLQQCNRGNSKQQVLLIQVFKKKKPHCFEAYARSSADIEIRKFTAVEELRALALYNN